MPLTRPLDVEEIPSFCWNYREIVLAGIHQLHVKRIHQNFRQTLIEYARDGKKIIPSDIQASCCVRVALIIHAE
jgi:hypothetical protein